MSKKHLIKLADAIKANREQFTEGAIIALANYCQSENPRFMRGRWLSYIADECGPCGGKVKRNA
jgi:hypothetical protein